MLNYNIYFFFIFFYFFTNNTYFQQQGTIISYKTDKIYYWYKCEANYIQNPA